jgi:hypothetical protein
MMRALFTLSLALVCGAAHGAQSIGRLFFTPNERAQLDWARTHKQRPQSVAPAEPAEVSPAPHVITYDGIVRRSDGRAILWLNSRAAEEKEALSGLPVTGRVRPDGAVTLHVPQSGGNVDLKVGQRAELHTGKVTEGRAPATSSPDHSTPQPKAPSDANVGRTEKGALQPPPRQDTK